MSDAADPIEEAAAAFAEAALAGRAPDPDAFCRERASLGPALRARIDELLFALGGLPSAAAAPALAAGRTIGDFTIVREIGRGGMGVVFEAEQRSLGRRVALKVLPAHLTLQPESVERFRREASVAARLRHPGIVEVYAVGEAEGHHFFAMELVEGTPFRPAIKEPIETACRIAAAVADALDHAHRAGVIHRDVKPSNILVRPDGRAVLTDFGLARAEGLPSLTVSGELAGTAYYVAPEQASGRRGSVDARTDVYGLGITLYEVLSGRRPFEGDTSQEVLRRIVEEEPASPDRWNPRLNGDLVTIVLKSIEKDPAARYASAAELAADLRALLEYRPIAARRTPGWRRIERWARRRPAVAALVAVLALAIPSLAALGGYVAAKQPEIRAAEAAARSARTEQAIEEGFLRLAERDLERAGAAFDRALADDPRSPEALAGNAMVRAQKGAAPAVPRSPGEPKTPADLFLAGVLELGPGGSSERAVELLSRAVRLSPPRALYHFERAYAAGTAKDARAAREEAEAIEVFWPDSAKAHYWRGFALHSIDRDGAIAAYRRSLELDATQGLAHVNLAILVAEAGDARGAILLARRGCELEPRLAKAHYTLASLLQESGETAEAIASYRRSLELDPSDARARSQLGIALAKTGDAAGGLAEMRRAAELDAKNPARHHNLGNLLATAGDYDAARGAYRRALELDPAFGPAHLSLGTLLTHQGDAAQGAVHLRRAVELDPSNDAARKWLARALADLERR